MYKLILSFLSQKGGITKSEMAKLVAVELARTGLKVLIADMDTSQSTCFRWFQRRIANDQKPFVEAKKFESVQKALDEGKKYEVVIFDGAPHATRMTAQIAKVSTAIILPTSSSIEDLEPQVDLAHELVETGIDSSKLIFVLSRIGNSKVELSEAKQYLKETGYTVLEGFIPERTAFRRNAIYGRALTETKYPKLNERCEKVVQDLINTIGI